LEGQKNGELFQLMIDEGFTHLVTFDNKLPQQQNFNRYPIPVVVIVAPYNTYDMMMKMYDEIVDVVINIEIGLNIVAYSK
jgi:hypothetical protein